MMGPTRDQRSQRRQASSFLLAFFTSAFLGVTYVASWYVAPSWSTVFDKNCKACVRNTRRLSFIAQLPIGVPWGKELTVSGDMIRQAREVAEKRVRGGLATILYLHVFKCGGSVMCKMAQMQSRVVLPPFHLKCKATSLLNSYKPVEDGVPESVFWVPFHRWTAIKQLDYLHKNLTNVNFVSNEIGAGQEMIVPGDVVYVTTLRNPLTRAISGALYNCMFGNWGKYNCSRSIAENLLSTGCQSEPFWDGLMIDKIGPCKGFDNDAQYLNIRPFCEGPIAKRFLVASRRLQHFYSAVLVSEQYR